MASKVFSTEYKAYSDFKDQERNLERKYSAFTEAVKQAFILGIMNLCGRASGTEVNNQFGKSEHKAMCLGHLGKGEALLRDIT